MRSGILAFCWLLAVAAAPAMATDTPAGGGLGGDPFRITCKDGFYLVGLQGRVGKWLDQIQPLCAKWLQPEHAFTAPLTGQPIGKSQGGELVRKSCSLNYHAIHDLELWFMSSANRIRFVASFVMGCRTMEPPGKDWFTDFGEIPRKYIYRPRLHVTCPAGEIAVGLHGSAGLFVDALGLVCAPAPPSPTVGAISGVDQRQASIDRPVLDPKSSVGSVQGGNTCLPGFVWRLAGPADDVCVPPESQARAVLENAAAAARHNPKGGAYGPNTCLQGFVWRNAFPGDVVCVTPEVRAIVQQENALGPSRTADAPGTSLMLPK